MFCKIPVTTYTTISVMLVYQFVYAEAFFDFEGNILNRKLLVMDSFYAWIFIKGDSKTGVVSL